MNKEKGEIMSKVHYQRTDVILRGWCGIALGEKSTGWTIEKEEVTCKNCLVAIKKHKTQDNLKIVTAGWSKDFSEDFLW